MISVKSARKCGIRSADFGFRILSIAALQACVAHRDLVAATNLIVFCFRSTAMKRKYLIFILVAIFIITISIGCEKQTKNDAPNAATPVEKKAQDDGENVELSDLLTYDRGLSDDPEITFVFVTVDASGHTYTTQHSSTGQSTTFYYTD